jgi:endonuclease YncB( thermonuclease family)
MRARTPTLALLVLAAPVAAGADWLVWVGGGLRETKGPIEAQGRQVRFHDKSGALMSVALEDVDVAASRFLSWQVSARPAAGEPDPVPWERAPAPPPGSGQATAPVGDGGECAAARLVRVVDSETLELELGGRREIVHLACLDAPEERNRFPEIAYFGLQAADVLARLASPGTAVCVVEERQRPDRDRAGHRVAYVRFADGRDVGAELVRRGYGVRSGAACRMSSRYDELERAAQAAETGHWGPGANEVAVAVIGKALAFHAVGPPRRAAGG